MPSPSLAHTQLCPLTEPFSQLNKGNNLLVDFAYSNPGDSSAGGFVRLKDTSSCAARSHSGV